MCQLRRCTFPGRVPIGREALAKLVRRRAGVIEDTDFTFLFSPFGRAAGPHPSVIAAAGAIPAVVGKPETSAWEALNAALLCRQKVNSRSPNPQLLIALHSPNGLRETGLRMCLPEKSQDIDLLGRWAVRSLQSGLYGNYREIRALFAYFRVKGAKFLCASDCVAERVGFEPTLPFRVNTLSKRAPSATRPSLRRKIWEGRQLFQGYRIAPSRPEFMSTWASLSFYGQASTSANRQRKNNACHAKKLRHAVAKQRTQR